MSYFYGTLKDGYHKPKTSTGLKKWGLQADIQGSSFGVKTFIRYDDILQEDVVDIYMTSGREGYALDRFFGTLTIENYETGLKLEDL